MEFYVEKRVLDLGLKIKFVVIEGIDNHKTSSFLDKKDELLNKLINDYKDLNIDEDKILSGFHKIHENGEISKRKNTPASENLIRSLIERDTFYSINPIVDIYNIISIKSKLCLGAHDIDKVSGNVTLRFHNGSETFIPVGDGTIHKVKLNEYSYIDDNNDILCRLEVRQVEKTKVTEDTKNVFYIVEGNMETPSEYLNEVCEEIIRVTTNDLGGNGYIKEAIII